MTSHANPQYLVQSSWNVMAHGDAREGKGRGNWRMEWVASTLHTTSEHGVSSITTADAHTSAASSRLNWRPRRFKWTCPFRRQTISGFCACAITFQTQSTSASFVCKAVVVPAYFCQLLYWNVFNGHGEDLWKKLKSVYCITQCTKLPVTFLTFHRPYLSNWQQVPCCTIIFEKPAARRPVTNFPTFCGTRGLITIITWVRYWTLSSV